MSGVRDGLAVARGWPGHDSHRVIGLMTGTSADAIDAVLVRLAGRGLEARHEIMAYEETPLPDALRREVLEIAGSDAVSLERVMELDAALGEAYAGAALALLGRAKIAGGDVDAIGSHGQTVRHRPRHPGRALTLQLGSAATLAERTGITVVSDFRQRDAAAGGEGAPLVPIADWWLFRSPDEARALLNLGGMANVTHLPRGAALDDVFAFDTGPGNAVLDGLVGDATGGLARHDDGGMMAAAGSPHEGLLRELLADPFFETPPPRSTGREHFGQGYAFRLRDMGDDLGLSLEDLLATAVELTAASVAEAIRRWLAPRGGVEAVYVSGGGVRNSTLMIALRRRLEGVRVDRLDVLGVAAEAKEALAFALLAHLTLSGVPGNVPGATGAARPVDPRQHHPRPMTRGVPMPRGLRLHALHGWAVAPILLLGCAPLPPPRVAPAPAAGVPPVVAAPATAPSGSPPAVPLVLDGEPTFDVGLTWDVDSLQLAPEGTVVVRYPRPGGGQDSLNTSSPITLRVSGAQLLVEPLGRSRAVPLTALESRDTLWVGSADAERGAAPWIRWDGRRWRGRFKAFLGPRGRITLATRVKLETYLEGVVPGEIGRSATRCSRPGARRRSRRAATRCSTAAVAARRASTSTARSRIRSTARSRRRSRSPHAAWRARVARWRCAMGKPIRANYRSTCGGISADVWEAWPAATGAVPREPSRRRIARRAATTARRRRQLPLARGVDRGGRSSQNLRRFGPAQGVPLPTAGVGRDPRRARGVALALGTRLAARGCRRRTGGIVDPGVRAAPRLAPVGASRADPALEPVQDRRAARSAGARRPCGCRQRRAVRGTASGLCQTGALGMARAGASAQPRFSSTTTRASSSRTCTRVEPPGESLTALGGRRYRCRSAFAARARLHP